MQWRCLSREESREVEVGKGAAPEEEVAAARLMDLPEGGMATWATVCASCAASLSVRLHVCLSVCLSVCPSVCRSVCLSV